MPLGRTGRIAWDLGRQPPRMPPGFALGVDQHALDGLWRERRHDPVVHPNHAIRTTLNGTSLSGSGSPSGASTDWQIVGVGDFNGDGKADILWRHTSGALYIWELDGTSLSGTGSPGGASTDWKIQ